MVKWSRASASGIGAAVVLVVAGAMVAPSAFAVETNASSQAADAIAEPAVSKPVELTDWCFLPPAALDAEAVDAFLAEPGSLLQAFPGGGVLMSSRVRALAGSRAATIEPLLALASTGSEAQRLAIASGLARTAGACAGASPDYAAFIQEKVALSNDPILIGAFTTAAAEIEAAAIPLVPGGAPSSVPSAGGIAGSGPAGTGTLGRRGDSFVQNADADFPIKGHDPYFYDRKRDDDSLSPTLP